MRNLLDDFKRLINENLNKSTQDVEENSIEEGWREIPVAIALAASSLGGNAMDKTAKAEPKKIEYSTTKSNQSVVNIAKKELVDLLKDNTPNFKDFRNYQLAVDFIISIDVSIMQDKIIVIDEYGDKTVIELGKLSPRSDIQIQNDIKQIMLDKLINHLVKIKERRVAKLLKP